MKADSAKYEFTLDNQFFVDLDGPEVQKGKLAVELNVKKTSGVFLLDFQTEGFVIVPCDRCLDEMELPVSTSDKLKVKLGSSFAEEGDIVVVPEDDDDIAVELPEGDISEGPQEIDPRWNELKKILDNN